jgi:hypothetical protein
MCVTKVIKYNIFILIYQHLKTAEYFCPVIIANIRDLFTACRNRLELSPLDCRKLYITTIYDRDFHSWFQKNEPTVYRHQKEKRRKQSLNAASIVIK